MILLLLIPAARGAVINADPTEPSITNAVGQAANTGDTIQVAAGTLKLTNTIQIPKAVKFYGAGSNAASGTIIQDFGGKLNFTLTNSATTEFSGWHLTNGTRATNSQEGIVVFNGSNADTRNFWLHNNYFINLSNSMFGCSGAFGLVSHNYVEGMKQVLVSYIRHSNMNGGAYGDGSISTNDLFGTEQKVWFVFNTFTNSAPLNHVTMIDGDSGARMGGISNIFGKGSVEWHGAEASRLRGGREGEFIWNTFIGNDSGQAVALIRSGVCLMVSNTIRGYYGSLGNTTPFTLEVSRVENAVNPWSTGNAERAGADGINPWHSNNASGPYTSETVSTGHTEIAGVRCSVDVAGTPWAVNEHQGRSIVKTSGKSATITRSGDTATVSCTGHGFSTGNRITIKGAAQPAYNEEGANITVDDANTFRFTLGSGHGNPATPATGTIYCFQGYSFSDILSNTVNRIYYRHSSQGAGGPNFFLRFTNSPADTFSIYKVEEVYDGIGRIGGTLISGDNPSRPAGNDQTTSMCYAWGNTVEGDVAAGFNSAHPFHAIGGRHWTNGVAKAGWAPRVTFSLLGGQGDPPASSATGTATAPLRDILLQR